MQEFIRTGPLLDITSYPDWAQDLVADCADARGRVVGHELFRQMRDARLGEQETRTFLAGVWPVIEQFPQYMAMNLVKVQNGRTRGHDMARRYREMSKGVREVAPYACGPTCLNRAYTKR